MTKSVNTRKDYDFEIFRKFDFAYCFAESTQSPPLPPRDAPLPPTNNITHRDNTLSRNECRQAIGWLNEVKAFIYDNFDSDEVGVDENIERIENVEKIFCRQR